MAGNDRLGADDVSREMDAAQVPVARETPIYTVSSPPLASFLPVSMPPATHRNR